MRGQIRQEAQRLGIDMHVTGLGSIFNFHFTKEEPRSYRSALKGDMGKLYNFYLALIANGLLVPPYTHAMISAAHTEEDVERTIAICGQVLKKLKQLES
jgi:glutamate-1-semialdehyde 2,1-aminomutase